jgi:NADPH:quinone reductase-like Zn-dependent oxidoreductase
MKAVVYTRYGSPDVLRLQDIETPAPKDDEVLVRVHAVSINDWDWQLLQGRPLITRLLPAGAGLFRPKHHVLGSDIAGRVERGGKDVTRLKSGDAVFGDISGRWGGLAEYVRAPARALTPIPDGMSFAQAAAIPQAAMLAVQGLRDGCQVRAGQSVLINGAGGGAGTFAIQLARAAGAAEITGVDSAAKFDVMRALGCDHVIDYAEQDFTQTGRQYDAIFDVRTDRPPSAYVRALKPDGVYATVGGAMGRILRALVAAPRLRRSSGKHLRIVTLKPNRDISYLCELFAQDKLVPVIDGHYTLDQAPEAFCVFGRGEQRGKLVVSVVPEAAEVAGNVERRDTGEARPIMKAPHADFAGRCRSWSW